LGHILRIPESIAQIIKKPGYLIFGSGLEKRKVFLRQNGRLSQEVMEKSKDLGETNLMGFKI
jgi:hypothetical protein